MRAARFRGPLLLLLSMTVLSGCGLFGPDTYELDERTVQVEIGETFTLEVPVDVAMGEQWYLTVPKPDVAVVRSSGMREHVEGAGDGLVGGGKGTDYFDFKAVGAGTTAVRLIQCPVSACAGGGSMGGPVMPSPSPTDGTAPHPDRVATVHTYTVTVRKP